jgi:transcriptional regulator with XRE-family HTH domain
MTLKSHLKLHGISLADFAERIGEKERAVRNWYYGVRQPSLACVAKIEAATGGAVALLDWLATDNAS